MAGEVNGELKLERGTIVSERNLYNKIIYGSIFVSFFSIISSPSSSSSSLFNIRQQSAYNIRIFSAQSWCMLPKHIQTQKLCRWIFIYIFLFLLSNFSLYSQLIFSSDFLIFLQCLCESLCSQLYRRSNTKCFTNKNLQK